MLRCDGFGERDRLVEIADDDEGAPPGQHFLDVAPPRQLRELARDLALHRLHHACRRRQQDRAFVAAAVLGLRQQVGGDI